MNIKLLLLSLPLFISCNSQKDTQSTPPPPILTEAETHLPENALYGIEVADGLQVQLFASEPMVRNPTNIDIDEKGRVWIAENVNYRPKNNPDNPYQEGGDQIIILEDTDQDGKADKRSIFYQGKEIDGVMGLCVVGNKAIISSSPHIWVLTDTNGDNKADGKEILFTGMGGPQGDHNVHSVTTGPDGRFYFNYGNSAGKILDKDGNPMKDRLGRDINYQGKPYWGGMIFRCNPDGSNLEILAHNFRNNYEVSVDAYGNMWQSDNDDDGYKSVRINYVMEYGNYGYRDELTGDHWQKPRSGMSEVIQEQHWHQHDPGVVPNLLITGSGSPCGMITYEGHLLPEKYHGQLIHAEAGPGLVRAYLVEKKGAGFQAKMENVLWRTDDVWVRPSDVSIAPDGSLFACDWYDPGVGGHLAGDPLGGRIYRIAPEVSRYQVNPADFSTPEGAVLALQSPNSKTRYLAQQSLKKMGVEAIPALKTLYENSDIRVRVRALWVLAAIDPKILQLALLDQEASVRLTGIRAARMTQPNRLPGLIHPIINDPSAEVRREIAIALYELPPDQIAPLWAELAKQYHGKDRWYLEALGIGASNNWEDCLQHWLEDVGENWNTPAGRDIVWRSRTSQTFDMLMTILQNSDLSTKEIARFLRATDFQQHPNKDQQLASLLSGNRSDQNQINLMVLSHLSPEFVRNSQNVKAAVNKILPDIKGTETYIDLVGQLALKDQLPEVFQMAMDEPERKLGVKAAKLILDWEGVKRFQEEVESRIPASVVPVIELFGNLYNSEGKKILKEIALDGKQDMDVRIAAIHASSKGWGWERLIKDILDEASLPDELVAVAATNLLTAFRPVDRQLAMEYLGKTDTEGQEVNIGKLLAQNGDLKSGQVHFKQYCSSCHQVNQEGIAFGPDLSEIGNKLGKDALYGAIVYPSAGISHGFEGEMIQLDDGIVYSGYVLSENEQTISLRIMGGLTQTISKSGIEKRNKMNQSLMTGGLHLALGEDKLIDLVEYLTSLKNAETLTENPYQGKILYEQ